MSTTTTINPAADLTGDGFLSDNATFGNVWDSYTRASKECMLVGGDTPSGNPANFQAYLRFVLSSLGATYVARATLGYYLAEVNSPTENPVLYKFVDFGTLDFSDWNGGNGEGAPDVTLTAYESYGEVLTPATPVGWLTEDVTAGINADRAASRSAAAFWFWQNNEPKTLGHFYAIVAADNGALIPYLECVELTAPTGMAVLFAPNGGAVCSWTSTTGGEEEGFKVYRSPDYGSTWILAGTVGSGVVTFTDDPRPGHNIYRVASYRSTYLSTFATWDGLGRREVIS